MKSKIYVLCLSLLVFMSCSKEEPIQEQQTLEKKSETFLKAAAPKISVCHFAKSDNIWEFLEVNENSLNSHLKHGDAVDMDGDGYFNKDNGCSETDCDDSDAAVNPGASEICDNSIDDNCNGETDENCGLNNETIRVAVEEWLDDPQAAEEKYGDISDWDVSNVTDMIGLFSGAISFNQDISNWDVSEVINMSYMFFNCIEFNQDIGNWNVSNVMDMSGMFGKAIMFDQDLNGWNTSNVIDMEFMFQEAHSFNQDISAWDVSSVTDMYAMFIDASSFNQDLSEWDVDQVTACGLVGGLFSLGADSWTEAYKPNFTNCVQ